MINNILITFIKNNQLVLFLFSNVCGTQTFDPHAHDVLITAEFEPHVWYWAK